MRSCSGCPLWNDVPRRRESFADAAMCTALRGGDRKEAQALTRLRRSAAAPSAPLLDIAISKVENNILSPVFAAELMERIMMHLNPDKSRDRNVDLDELGSKPDPRRIAFRIRSSSTSSRDYSRLSAAGTLENPG